MNKYNAKKMTIKWITTEKKIDKLFQGVNESLTVSIKNDKNQTSISTAHTKKTSSSTRYRPLSNPIIIMQKTREKKQEKNRNSNFPFLFSSSFICFAFLLSSILTTQLMLPFNGKRKMLFSMKLFYQLL